MDELLKPESGRLNHPPQTPEQRRAVAEAGRELMGTVKDRMTDQEVQERIGQMEK